MVQDKVSDQPSTGKQASWYGMAPEPTTFKTCIKGASASVTLAVQTVQDGVSAAL